MDLRIRAFDKIKKRWHWMSLPEGSIELPEATEPGQTLVANSDLEYESKNIFSSPYIVGSGSVSKGDLLESSGNYVGVANSNSRSVIGIAVHDATAPEEVLIKSLGEVILTAIGNISAGRFVVVDATEIEPDVFEYLGHVRQAQDLGYSFDTAELEGGEANTIALHTDSIHTYVNVIKAWRIPRQHGFSASIHTQGSIPANTWTSILFAGLAESDRTWDDGDWLIVGGDEELIVPSTGRYRIMVDLAWADNDVGIRSLEIKKNSDTYASGEDVFSPPAINAASDTSVLDRTWIDEMIDLNRGDTLRVWVNQQSGGNLAIARLRVQIHREQEFLIPLGLSWDEPTGETRITEDTTGDRILVYKNIKYGDDQYLWAARALESANNGETFRARLI